MKIAILTFIIPSTFNQYLRMLSLSLYAITAHVAIKLKLIIELFFNYNNNYSHLNFGLHERYWTLFVVILPVDFAIECCYQSHMSANTSAVDLLILYLLISFIKWMCCVCKKIIFLRFRKSTSNVITNLLPFYTNILPLLSVL